MDITRRTFLVHAGRSTIALAVVSIAGCGPGFVASAPPSQPPQPSPPSPSPDTSGAASSPPPASTAGAVNWHRADLGFVSAYVLARGGEASVVDTGVERSEGAIEQALMAAGLGWDAVGYVILTHRHGDHVGSTAAVLSAAPAATAYAGAEDIPGIASPRPLTAVADGDSVMGLRIVATPGHTAGHISVLDEVGGILVAGDALGTVDGTLAGSNPQFTADEAQAKASVAKLGKLTFETLLVGHGDPVLDGASAQVAALAAGG